MGALSWLIFVGGGLLVLFIVLGVSLGQAASVVESNADYANNIKEFCQEENRTTKASGFGGAEYYCEGKLYTCNSENCFYVEGGASK